jgi:putative intracellular protease/amidase
MQLAVVLYPRFTVLDMAGPHEILGRLPGVETVFVAEATGPVTNDFGSLAVSATASFEDVPRPDIVFVPGGPGDGSQMEDGPLRQWLRAVDKTTMWTTAVCTGTVVLATSGVLEGRRATSHWLALPDLERYGAKPVEERVVVDDKYVTGAGVSAGIDMALHLAGRIAGDDVAQTLQLAIEYAPQPPYDAGSPATAPAAITKGLRDRREAVLWGDL